MKSMRFGTGPAAGCGCGIPISETAPCTKRISAPSVTGNRLQRAPHFSPTCLLQRAADLREDAAGVGADQADGTDDDDEDHGEHDRVFGDVLTLLVAPKLV